MWKLEPRTAHRPLLNLILPVLAIVVTLALCSGLIAISGASIVDAYTVMH